MWSVLQNVQVAGRACQPQENRILPASSVVLCQQSRPPFPWHSDISAKFLGTTAGPLSQEESRKSTFQRVRTLLSGLGQELFLGQLRAKEYSVFLYLQLKTTFSRGAFEAR